MTRVKKIKTKSTIWLSVFLTLSALSFFNLSLYLNSKPRLIFAKNDTSESKILIWQSFLKSHPDYLEGWIELSKLYLYKDSMTEAKSAFTKAYEINPNSEGVQDLKKLF